MSEAIITLRTISSLDTSNIVRWRNAHSVRANLYTQTELTEQQHETWLQTKVATGFCTQYIIVVQEACCSTDIGTVFIKNIDRENNKGEFGIFVGEESARGKGYGKQATKQILDVAFRELKLNRVYLTVMADNLSAIRAYKNAGFLVEGMLREDYLRSDGYIDVVVMGITLADWKATNTSDEKVDEWDR